MPTLTKQILPIGKHTAKDKKGNFVKTNIPKERALKWINNVARMNAKGLHVPFPREHNFEIIVSSDLESLKENEENLGVWKRLWLEDNMLMGDIECKADCVDEVKALNGCSIYADDYTDADGNVWPDVLNHICATDKPLALGTDGYETKSENSLSIAMSSSVGASDDRSKIMRLIEVLKEKSGIEIDACDSIAEFMDRLTAVLKNASLGGDSGKSGSPRNRSYDLVMSDDSTKTKSSPTENLAKAKRLIDKLKKENETKDATIKRLTNVFQVNEKTALKNRLEELSKVEGFDKDTLKGLEVQLESYEVTVNDDGSIARSPLHNLISTHEQYVKTDDKSDNKTDDKTNDTQNRGKKVKPSNPDDDGKSGDDEDMSAEDINTLVNSL